MPAIPTLRRLKLEDCESQASSKTNKQKNKQTQKDNNKKPCSVSPATILPSCLAFGSVNLFLTLWIGPL
jgi:hypothetical protein